jgi:hypothetical protein
MSRRGVLSGGTVAAAGAVIGRHPRVSAVGRMSTVGAGRPSLGVSRAMIMQVAEAGSVFPVRLPIGASAGSARARRAAGHLKAVQSRLEPGLLQLGAAHRLSIAGLARAERVMPAAELSAAREGANLLVRADLLDSGRGTLLAALGKLAGTSPSAERTALICMATLAVQVVFSDATYHEAAKAGVRWLNLLSAMHAQGMLPTAIRRGGLQ